MSESLNQGKVDTIEDWLNFYAKFSNRLLKTGRHVDDQRIESSAVSPMLSTDGLNLVEMQSIKSTTLNAVQATTVTPSMKNTGYSFVMISKDIQGNSNTVESSGAQALDPETGLNAEKYQFLSNWERLWDYFVGEDSDEVAVHLPLYRIAIELIFHPRMLLLMRFAYVWNMILTALLISRYTAIQSGQMSLSLITFTLQFFVYTALCAVNRGSAYINPISSKKSQFATSDGSILRTVSRTASMVLSAGQPRRFSTNPSPSELFADAETAQEAIDQDFSLTTTLRRCWRRVRVELPVLWMCWKHQDASTDTSKANATRKAVTRKDLSYYRWLNLGMKVLVRDYGLNIKQIGFNRRSYRFFTLFSLVLYPIYAIIFLYCSVLLEMGFLCGGSVFGHYGGDDAIGEEYCSYYQIYFIVSLMGITVVIMQVLYGCSIMITLTGLAYGGEIAYRLGECWIERFHSLRRVPKPTSFAEATEERHSTEERKHLKENKKPHSPKDQELSVLRLEEDSDQVMEYINRDATEHYLFICELLRKVGDMISPVIILLIFMTLYSCLGIAVFLVEIAMDGTLAATPSLRILFAQKLIFIAIRFFLLSLSPILSVAFANSYFLKLFEVFRGSDSQDYAVIGGRDHWLQMFVDTPANWTFFGLAITPERLTALLWTVLVTVGGILLTTVISSSA